MEHFTPLCSHLKHISFVFILIQTFLTLSLQDMASRVQLSGPQEAEKYVLHMVSQPHYCHMHILYGLRDIYLA